MIDLITYQTKLGALYITFREDLMLLFEVDFTYFIGKNALKHGGHYRSLKINILGINIHLYLRYQK